MANWLMICSDAAGAVVAVSATRYQPPAGLLGTGANEVNNRINVKESYTWEELYARVTANAATTNACTVRSRKNAANGNMVISIAAGTTGVFQDTSNSDSLVANDLIDYSQVNADAAGTVTFTIVSSILVGTNPILTAQGDFTISAGVSRFSAIAGAASGASTESTVAYPLRTATTLSDMRVVCTTNTVLAASTVYSRIDSANGNQTVSIPASTTGVYDDTTHTDAVAVGQTVDTSCTAGAGGTSLNIRGVTYRSTSAVLQLVNQISNVLLSNFGTTYYLILNGHPQRNNTTEANEQTLARIAFSARNLFVRFNTNTVNGASTVVTRKSGADGNLTVSIPASTSGNYEDTTHSDAVLATDTYNFSVALGGTSGTTYIAACNVEQVGAGTLTILPSGIEQQVALGSPKLNFIINLSGIAQPIALGTPQLNLTIKPTGIAQTIDLGTPTVIKLLQIIAPTGIAQTIVFGAPKLNLEITPSGIAQLVAVGTPALVIEQFISPSGIAQLVVFGTPAVGISGVVTLRPSGIAQLIALGTPTLLKYVWHVILDGQYTTETPRTNRAYVIGRDIYGNPVYGTAVDSTELGLVGERLDFQQELAVPTDAKAGDVATAILSKMRLSGKGGVILIPPNCGQELFDVVQVTDSQGNQSAVKFRVVGLRFEYNPKQARYRHRLILGAP